MALSLGSWFRVSWLAVLSCASSHAEILPDWSPAELASRSDLVVIGTLEGKTRVTVSRVIKGATDTKVLEVPSVLDFRESVLSRDKPPVEYDRAVMLFIDQRAFPPRITGNGLFRVGKGPSGSGVFGYYQEMNPGPYVLDAAKRFGSLDELAEKVTEARAGFPAARLAILEKVKAGIPSKSFQGDLGTLCGITRRGDIDTLQAVGTLDQAFPEMDPAFIAQFLRDVRDPAALDLMIRLHDRKGGSSMLQVIGALGNPSALPWFRSLLKRENGPESYHVVYGMRELYLACETRGDTASCDLIREEIFREVDKAPGEYMRMSTQILSVIPHQGSVERLERALEHHSKKDQGTAYNIRLHLDECRKKIAASAPSPEESRH